LLSILKAEQEYFNNIKKVNNGQKIKIKCDSDSDTSSDNVIINCDKESDEDEKDISNHRENKLQTIHEL